VLERRAHLDRLHVDALELGAEAAYRAEDYRRADQLVSRAVERDPLRERSWRLSMRVKSALGDRDAVTAVYQRCIIALQSIGVAPEEGTTALARRLRGEVAPRQP
jgi:DNA-binding SARP family transcriptional activator